MNKKVAEKKIVNELKKEVKKDIKKNRPKNTKAEREIKAVAKKANRSNSKAEQFMKQYELAESKRIKQVKDLALAFRCPGNAPRLPVFSTGYDAFPMTNTLIEDEIELDVPSSDTPDGNDIFDRTSQVCFITKNPMAAILQTKFPNGNNCAYQGYFTLAEHNSSPNYQQNVPSYSQAIASTTFELDVTVKLCYFTASSGTYRPHGNIIYAGVPPEEKEARMIFLSKGEILAFWGNTIKANTIRAILTKWTPDDGFDEEVDFVTLPTTTSTDSFFEIESPGYYGLRLQAIADGDHVANGILLENIRYSSDVMTIGHKAIPDLFSSIPKLKDMRINSVQVVFSNIAAELAKEGKIGLAASPKGKHWLDWIALDTGSALLTSIVKSPVNDVKPASRGIESAVLVEDFNELEFKRYFESNDNVILDSKYPLEGEFPYLVLDTVVPDPDARNIMAKTVMWFNARTDSQWLQTQMPTVEMEVVIQALKLAAQMPRINENPLHLAAIASFLKKAIKTIAGGIVDYGPTVIKAADVIRKF